VTGVSSSSAVVRHSGEMSTRLGLGRYPATFAIAALTCALAPAYTVRWHIGLYPTTVLEDAIGLTVAAFALESWRARAMPQLRTPFTLPAAIFLIAGAIDVVVAPDRRAALGIYRAYLIEPIAFFLVLANVVDTSKRAFFILAGLGLGGLVVGVVNWFVIADALRHHTLNPAVTAPVTVYQNANDIALYLVPLIAVGGSIVLFGSDRGERLSSAVFVVLAVISTMLSFSRGGYLALAVVALGLALAHRRRWWLISAAAAAAIVLLLIPPINHRVTVELDFTNPSNTLVGRFELWTVALQMLQQHPLFGAGLSGFAAVIAPFWNPTHADRFIYPHNILLTFWSETGLLGLAAFIWIMLTGFVLTWRGWRATSIWRPIELGVFWPWWRSWSTAWSMCLTSRTTWPSSSGC
jgi:O-antigen ligase